MTGIDRRGFLKIAASSAGTAAAATALPPIIRQALAIPAAFNSGTLNDVEHVVVFMQENRAFDHYYGSLRGVRGFGDRTPAPLASGRDVWHQPYAGNADGYILPFHADTTTTSAICESAPAMSYPVDTAIWNRAKFDAWNTARTPGLGMSYFTRNDLGYYYALADAFTTCDHYFCSTLTQTNPNRLHLFSGSNGLSVGKPAVLDNSEPSKGFTWTTYAERLQAAGVSWKVYQQSNNFDDNALAWFANFKRAKPGQPLYDRGMAKVSDIVSAFTADVQNGTLPQVSWIVAPDYLSEHANYKPAYGEDLSARLLAALAANPAVWSKTVFLLNYDENGGFFDHMTPPTPPATSSDGISTVSTVGEITSGQPIGFGFRVPLIAISPWSRGGYVCSQVFDHTSVIRFLEQRFGVQEPNISAWRRAVSGDLTSAFDFANPNTQWPSLPGTSGYTALADQQCTSLPQPTIPSTQSMPVAEKGTRPARALPYVLQANGRVDAANGKFWVDFDNASASAAAAVFHAYAANRSDGPWRYTVEAGKTLSDYWSAVAYSQGLYDVELHGPNGFLRRFVGCIPAVAGQNTPNLEVSASYDAVNSTITLTLTNSGSAACSATVTDNAYALGAARSYAIAAGASVRDTWSLTLSGNWYDFSVTTPQLAGYLRRYAGHLENGQASVSDPAMTAA
jgi:phospholipase C